jgi:hypothetical protein
MPIYQLEVAIEDSYFPLRREGSKQGHSTATRDKQKPILRL